MSELPVRPSRVDFEKVDLNQIQRILSTGTLDSLPSGREGVFLSNGDGTWSACQDAFH